MRSVFLDTSVLVDQHFRDKRPEDPCLQIMELAQHGQVSAFTAPQCLLTTIYFMENAKDRKGARKYTHKAIVEDMTRLLAFIKLIEVHAGHFGMAFRSSWPDIEDAVLYAAADSSGKVEAFVSEDKKGFRQAKGIPVMTSDAFLRQLKK
jgi:predicted nucleic acid-binding protein